MTVFTIGHSTRSLDDFIAALRRAGADCVVDVRRIPRSRRYPHFNADALGPALADAGILYRHIAALGGRRGRRRDGLPSPNTLWREEGFRNFADYAATPEFHAGLDELLALARARQPAVMCAEAVWWRCHRRIIADYLLVAGVDVEHILGINKIEPARLTPGAVPQTSGGIIYPG
jgi:uncharacterized protein (DUF488 family)